MRRRYEDNTGIADLNKFRCGIEDRYEALAPEDQREDHQTFDDYAFDDAEL